VPGYARVVPLAEIADAANDFNLNIRRYVDNSPPPEPHDVRAHLQGGVPAAEVNDRQAIFEALGFPREHAFAARAHDAAYVDFAPALTDRAAIRALVENDPGVQARHATVRERLSRWWTAYAPRLVELPRRRDLNRVRADILDSFVTALLATEADGASPLDRFKLAGVIAIWWTDTLPDFKTLLENGFPGVVDGWVDAIADAVEDDEAVGPAFDPFGHKLVRRTMADYLERIAATKADIARLKGEKEAFEQSNAPDELDEEELAAWNYAKELDRERRELKAENKDALKELAKLERVAATARASADDKRKATAAKMALAPVLDQLAALDAALTPYEQVKSQLADARALYRTLTAAFVNELKLDFRHFRPGESRSSCGFRLRRWSGGLQAGEKKKRVHPVGRGEGALGQTQDVREGDSALGAVPGANGQTQA
jgi:type I restriction enzyme M protein